MSPFFPAHFSQAAAHSSIHSVISEEALSTGEAPCAGVFLSVEAAAIGGSCVFFFSSVEGISDWPMVAVTRCGIGCATSGTVFVSGVFAGEFIILWVVVAATG